MFIHSEQLNAPVSTTGHYSSTASLQYYNTLLKSILLIIIIIINHRQPTNDAQNANSGVYERLELASNADADAHAGYQLGDLNFESVRDTSSSQYSSLAI
jgi:hypothetical protein